MRSELASIPRVLTLRYDPLEEPLRKPLTSSDFAPYSSYGKNLERSIFELIKKELLNKYDELKFKHISLSLSAGVDSRLTLAMIRTILPNVKIDCISVGFGDKDDEISQAREISRVYDCDFHGMILKDILSDLPKLISIVKKPRWNLYQFYAFEHGKQKSSVFYTGDGGDELFGGYTFRYQKFLSLLPRNAEWEAKAKLYLSCHERDWVPDQDKIFGSAVKFSWENIYQLFRKYFSNELEPLNQIFLADFNGKLLYDWLPTNVAFANFLGIKIESIFLSNAMVEFATHIPPHEKYDRKTNVGKIPLRSILIKQKGNEAMMEPIKKGFSVDLIALWNRNAREIVSSYVNLESEVVRNGIISKDWIIKAAQNVAQGDAMLNSRYINKMLSILALEIWYRLFISKSMSFRRKL